MARFAILVEFGQGVIERHECAGIGETSEKLFTKGARIVQGIFDPSSMPLFHSHFIKQAAQLIFPNALHTFIDACTALAIAEESFLNPSLFLCEQMTCHGAEAPNDLSAKALIQESTLVTAATMKIE